MLIYDHLHPLFIIELQGFHEMSIKDPKKPIKRYVKTF